ncbi:unnamed protein product [Plutella xylostella]|uniref:(diamondback moth) hypothetical protein n=2 Tax=Plutella xylostella TaxID=51655 RepID=A0A8S4EKR9_PLUXY|nr:unnamed protein product [Plutella xylostella]
MSELIAKMKSQKILETAKISSSFISPLFLVPKSDGTMRPIFNLKALNEFVLVDQFHLINMYRIPTFLQAKDWLCKIDLSQAYFHLAISQGHRRFLRLIYEHELLEMTCLPFGLSTAPKTFSILTNWIAQILREKNVRIVAYLDDYLIAHQSARVLQEHVTLTISTLQYLGWQINFEKSVLTPQKSVTYLGIVWDPWDNRKVLPENKCVTIVKKVSEVLEQKSVTIKDLQRVAGLLSFASFAVPRGRLNHRRLIMFLNSLPQNLTNDLYVMPQPVREELSWWVLNCHLPTPLHYPPPTHFLTTDASDLAWGAQLNNHALSGVWSKAEQTLHCNQKEMLAILHALQSHAHLMRHSCILMQCDNKTAVSYLRKEGGTRSVPLLEITYQILHLLDWYRIDFSIHHIPGKFNNHADHLSRHRRPPEWHLLPPCTEIVFKKFGLPMIDLFASEAAHVVFNYVTLDLRDRQAVFHDAFSVPWNYPLAWIFPPPFLIPKVLAHLNQSLGTFLIVVPRWHRVFWRADLKARSLAAPFTLRNLQSYLIDTSTGLPPPNVAEMTLEVWKCGGGLNK